MSVLSKILLIEYDRSTANVLALALKTSFETDIAFTSKQAIYKCDLYNYDVIVFDLNLPGISGMDFCQIVKQRGLNAPILFLTSDQSVMNKINLLDNGASDVIDKPFSLGELKARLRVLTRKVPTSPRTPQKLIIGDVYLDKNSCLVKREDKLIKLRKKEFALLEYLMINANKVVSREELLESVWKDKDELWTNTLDVHIKYLRDKLDRPFASALIKTVHGRGYIFEETKISKTNLKVK